MRKVKKIIFFLILLSQVYAQCCLRFDGRACMECPDGTHLYRGNCLFDIKDCANYRDGFQCAQCNTGYILNSTGDCVKAPPITQPQTNQSQNYNEVIINPKKLQGVTGDAFSICDDYLRTVKRQLSNTNIKDARARVYKNNTAHIIIQYQGTKNILYRGVLQFDLTQFTVKQLSFGQIKQSAGNKPQPQITTQPINLSNPTHNDKYTQVDTYIRLQNQQIAAYKTGNITTIPDGSYNFSILYASKNTGWEFCITATLLKDKTVTIYDTKIISSKIKNTPIIQTTNKQSLDNQPQSITPPPNTITNTITNQPTQSSDNNYKTLTGTDYSDQYYIINKDIIQMQLEQFSGIQPTKVRKLCQLPTCSFIFSYKKTDGSNWDIYTHINTQTYITKVDKILQTGPSSTPVSITFIKIPLQQIYQDITFLIVYDYIIRQSNKYKDANIQSVEKFQNKTACVYRIGFQSVGSVWQVVANANLPDIIPNGFTENRITQLKPNITNTTTTTTTTNIDKNQFKNITNKTKNNNTNANTNTNSNTNTNTNSNTKTITNNNINTSTNKSNQIFSIPIPISAPITVQSISNNRTTNLENISIPSRSTPLSSQPNNITLFNSSNITVSSSTNSTLFILPIPSSSSIAIQNAPTLPNSIPLKPQKQPQPSQQTSTKQKNKVSNSDESYSISMAEGIRQRMTGMAQLNRSQQTNSQFKEIDKTVRNSNQAQIKNAVILVAFVKQSGFTKTFFIFYASEKYDAVWQAQISRDILRKKTYILSFNKNGY